MLKVIIYILAMHSPLIASAQNVIDVTKSAYLKNQVITIDAGKSSIPIKCEAYASLDSKAEGIKVVLMNNGLGFSLYCKGSEIGSYWDLVVVKNKSELEKMNNAVSDNIDGEERWRTDSWLVDMDKDNYLDLVQLYKKFQQDPVKGNFKVVETTLKLFHWNVEDQKFKTKKLTQKDQAEMIKKFSFE